VLAIPEREAAKPQPKRALDGEPHALRDQQGLNSDPVRKPFALQALKLPVQVPGVFLFDARYAHHAPAAGKGLEKAETDAAEVARYLEKIRRKLEDGKRAANHADTRFDIAFEALLQIAICALRVNGYRTTTAAGHQQGAIQLLPKSIGIDPGAIRVLDEYRKKRSLGLYQADFEPSEKEVKAVTEAVERLRATLVAWIKYHYPELLKK
jgi:hypothetical protein